VRRKNPIHPLRHSEESGVFLDDVRIPSNFSVIERNVLCDVAISSLECFVRIKKEKDEILTASRNEASG
jgi:hypothetical protein